VAFAAQQTPIEHGVERSDALMQFWKRKDILQTHSLRLLLLLRLWEKKLYEKFCMALIFIKIAAMSHSWFLKITGAPDHSLGNLLLHDKEIAVYCELYMTIV